MKDFYFKNQCFIINNYDSKKPFSSFLPGIAGTFGIPLWVFYVNRGQGIASFGSRDKNGAIMEYFPANNSYLYVDRIGFRTFLKVEGQVYEFFGVDRRFSKRSMEIEPSCLRLKEERNDLKIRVLISYFILPNEPFGALVRRVKFEDYSGKTRAIEILDGLPRILPAGISHEAYKGVSNLMQSWMEVKNLENLIPYFKMRASTADNSNIKKIEDGNFYLSFSEGKLIKPIVDGQIIFGEDTSLVHPLIFENENLDKLINLKEIPVNKIPCAMTPVVWSSEGNSEKEISTLIGYVKGEEMINSKVELILESDYLKEKAEEAARIITDLTDIVETKSGFPIFDEYIRQNYLDNVLRGGHPLILPNSVYHIYSRKHGDLERDYNFFVTAPEYFSQGNGNFRDVCQNRRNDVFLNNRVFDYNLHFFGSLIQADGYNPLGVNGSSFCLKIPFNSECRKIIHSSPKLAEILKSKFTPGQILACLEDEFPDRDIQEKILYEILSASEQIIEAEYGEGYWQDHWTYLLDLLENHLEVYPDYFEEVLFKRTDYKYFNSPVTVLPRSEKYVLTSDGRVRQFNSLLYDQEKVKTCHLSHGSNWFKNTGGKIITTNLYSKLLVLSLNKFACLDPYGIGISYEADKPGWNDAMNGLPGLFGSGIGETIELYRLISFLLEKGRKCENQELSLMTEFVLFLEEIKKVQDISDQFLYWDKTTSLLEDYRENIRFTSEGVKVISVGNILPLLKKMFDRIFQALSKALDLGQGIYPTYLIYEPINYEPILQNGQLKKNRYGYVNVDISSFKIKVLPHFLEAPARALKTEITGLNKKTLHEKIIDTDLYDSRFRFFKTSVCLDEVGFEVGRITAFTKGWFERESNFLHMTYKYLLGLLEAGLYQEFFQEIKTNFICFMDPEVYGRSILENSSFLVPANNPDSRLWGKGFVARLSGSTAEMLSMWHLMYFGKNIFRYKDGELSFRLAPILSGEFFDSDGQVQVMLFGKTRIVYINPDHQNTYDESTQIKRMELFKGDQFYEVHGYEVGSNLAMKIRQGEFQTIKVFFK